MKESTRLFLEKSIGEMLADEKIQHDMMDVIDLFKDELEVPLVKELALGFTMGVLYFYSASILGVSGLEMAKAESKNAENEVLAIIRRRVPEIKKIIECIMQNRPSRSCVGASDF